MKTIIIAIFTALIMQSCCAYRCSQQVGNKKITEFGIAPYGSRPIKQVYEEKMGR